ncbi:wax ester/triacylglycerol synthase family O-acyltransferase [Corallococcus sp. bb12-1]|uniref:WS/DGAT/MGAT family O-acyltransferase n=1 Tax=Corallococcus sp. bb12-1 TaxID=2996784 RepID=UPI0022706C28|nr:wax ester/triacylglycerol synthase family O-acyltransferase [Corallococcus sp. bb12-1]MCY1044257.1 wax ester/triacylglycerol synthase family O-acyltransferase [Corallococcus sp. bb12-1]
MAGRERMGSMDAAWLQMEEPANLMMITAVLWFDGPMDRERLRTVVRERLVERYPRFRQRVVPGALGAPHWEDATDFDLDAHLSTLRVPATGGRAALEAVVGDWLGVPLERSRPLWHLHLVKGAARGDVLLARLHHCMADGIALARVLLTLTDPVRAGTGPEDAVRAEAVPARDDAGTPADPDSDGSLRGSREERLSAPGWMRLARGARAAFRKGVELVQEPILAGDLVLEGARGAAALGKLLVMPPDPRSPLRGPLGARKLAAWSEPVALARVKAVGQTLGGTVNDVLLTAVTGALRRYLASREAPLEDMHALVPVNLRPLDEPVPRELGNRFGVVFLRLPVHLEDPRRRLREVSKRMEALKRSPEAVVTSGALELLGRTPAALERVVVDVMGTKASLVATNVPGPRQPVSLAGARLDGLTFWVPQAGHVGLGVSLFSYAGQVTLGVASDASRVPDPGALVAAFLEELEALATVAP